MKLEVLILKGLQPYDPALKLQERLHAQRRQGQCVDTLLLLEHAPVYTLGRNATEANVLLPADELRTRGFEVVRTGRGGEVTYHGPGQLVAYPILDLRQTGDGAVSYVGRLEQVILNVLADFGLEGHTEPRNRGVWVGNEKIAAIGVRIAGHVTMHGFALNVRARLEDYRWIVPCGIRDRGVTSLHAFRPEVGWGAVVQSVVSRFVAQFGYDEVKVSELDSIP